jgi:hypothetical protein
MALGGKTPGFFGITGLRHGIKSLWSPLFLFKLATVKRETPNSSQ